MKMVVALLALAWPLHAQYCTGQLLPLRPLMCGEASPACICDTYGQNCRWMWGCASSSAPGQQRIDPLIPLMVQPVPQISPSPWVQQLILLRAMEQMQERRAQRQLEREREVERERETRWERIQEERRERQAKVASPRAAERLANWLAKVEAARARYPDYDEVVASSRELAITPVMTLFMSESEYGADVAYWLGKHPDRCRAVKTLSEMSPSWAIDKMVEIEAGVRAELRAGKDRFQERKP